LKVLFDAIRQLMAAPEPKKRKIGFPMEEKSRCLGPALQFVSLLTVACRLAPYG
jgi:hypothetical protein